VRLGILGGTFDPPHVGHLLAATDAFERLELDRLVLVPAATQPLKADAGSTDAAHRLAMVRAMVGDDPRFSVDPIEIDRAGLSYTVDTLAEYERRHPRAERFFLVGADTVGAFGKWREPGRVLRLARLVVLRRASDGPDESPMSALRAMQTLQSLMTEPGSEPPLVLETRRVDVSSTEVRARVRAGQSIRGFVPDAIAAYIERAGLYR
jgi:nicotinate-nucleotide adenylyltransferase